MTDAIQTVPAAAPPHLSADSHVIIVGGGQAGAQAAISLRQYGFSGRLTLIGAEPDLPYQRPPLSKDYLKGMMGLDRLLLRPASFWADQGIDIVAGRRVVALEREAGRVILETGEALAYDALILAMGAEPRRLPGQPESLRILTLRERADADRLQALMAGGSGHLAVVGGGYIGLEVAAAARESGLQVTVLESAPRLLARVAGAELATWLAGLHREAGIDIRVDQQVERIEETDQGLTLHLGDGTKLGADAVLVGIGVVPCDSLAREAGLACANGIIVDARGMTSDPAIFAVGDVACHPNPFFADEGLIRLESVHNATEQPKVAAAALCGRDETYAQVPWNWSNQLSAKMRFAGLARGHDATVVRGDPQTGKWALYYLREGRVIGCDAINAVAEFTIARQLIERRAAPDPAELADMSRPIKEIAAPFLRDPA